MIDTIINNILQDRDLNGGSTNWANWMSKLTIYNCQYCAENHGKIFQISILRDSIEIPIHAHPKCVCVYVPMRTQKAGYATDLGQDGADVYLIQFGILPTYYVTKASARRAGWQSFRGNFDDVLPGKMIGGDIYQNREGKLPSGPDRIWYEADINYDGGFRNRQRILYSNDGLVFVSYDHYQTFYEITQ